MKVVGVCSLPKIPASEPGVPDSPAQIVAVCDDGSVFRHSTLRGDTPWEELHPIPGSDRDIEKRDPSLVTFDDIKDLINIDSVREIVHEICNVNEDFSLDQFRSHFLHYFKDARMEAMTRQQILDRAYHWGLQGLRKFGELRSVADEDPPKWGRFRRLE